MKPAPPPPASLAGLARLGALFVAVLLLLGLLDDFAFFRVVAFQAGRRDTGTPLLFAAVYAAAHLLGIAGLVVACTHAWRAVRWTAWVGTALALALFAGFKSVNGYGFTFHEAALVWTEIDFIPSALDFFAGSYLVPVLSVVAAVWVASRAVRAFVPRLASPLLLVVPVAAVWANDRVLEVTQAKVIQAPVPLRVALLARYAYQHRTPYYGEREPPWLSPRREPLAPHVVLVMDESVRGDLLGLNGGAAETTPFLESVRGRILNYGVASSISNLSSSTNLALQAGLRPDQIPDRELRSLKNPNVFSYLQKAGFAAFLIDDQIYSGRPNDMMTGFDLAKLDGHWQLRAELGALPDYEIDFRAIDTVERLVRENERSFTYLIKAGAHFPYDAKYPPAEKHFRPTLSDGGEGDNLEKTLNSYRNALRWTVDAFLRELFERLERSGREVVVVYTADHGQSIEEAVEDAGPALSGRPLRWPHGTPVNPPVRQAAVPLLLFGVGGDVEARLRALYRPDLAGRVSQFEVFPSLLELAGYDRPEIRARYHYSLFDPAADRAHRVFVSGNLFGIGGGFYNHELVGSSWYLNEFTLETRPDG